MRTTFQITGELVRCVESTIKDPFLQARVLIGEWLQRQGASNCHANILDGGSFETGDADSRVECISVPEEGLWAVRHLSARGPDGEEPRIEGRRWTTEIALAAQPSRLHFGVRVLCSSSLPPGEAMAFKRPQIVKALAETFVVREVDVLSPEPFIVRREEDIDRLFRLVSSPERGIPVYLLTEPDRSRWGINVSEFLLDPWLLAERVLGVAYVVALPYALAFRWTDLVGKNWSAFLGAVRTYRPGLDFDQDNPADHPLVLADRILRFRYKDLTMDEAFTEYLVDQAHEYAASRWVDWGPCLFYVDARNRRAERARQSAREDKQWRAVYDEEISALKAKIEQIAAERDSLLDSLAVAERERDQARRENHLLRARLDALGRAARAGGGGKLQTTPLPTA